MLRRPPDRPDRLNVQAEVSQRPDDEGPIGKLMPERRVILEAVRPVNDLAIGPDMGGASLAEISTLQIQPSPGRYGSKKPQSLTSPLQEQHIRVWMPVHCATSHPRQYYLF
jgi:hypothetical protein